MNLFQNVSSAATSRGVGAERHVLDLQLCASVVRLRDREPWIPLLHGQKLKRNHVGLQNSAAAAAAAARSESLSKGETSKTDVPSANVAKFKPVAIKGRARSVSHLMNPRSVR